MASFPVPAPTQKQGRFRGASSRDVKISDYLGASRVLDGIALRPVIVASGDTNHPVPDVELDGNGIIATYRRARYHIEVVHGGADRVRLSDAIHAAMSLIEIAPDQDFLLIPIEPADVCDGRVAEELLLKRRNDLLGVPTREGVGDYSLRTGQRFSYEVDRSIWELAATLVADDVGLYAALFIREAMRDHHFIGDDIGEVIADKERHPATISEAVRMENGVHNSYKAIEAVHGGNLPEDRKKIVRNFHSRGVDLLAPVGYQGNDGVSRENGIDKLLRLRHSRDYKAAHGRIGGDRKNTYYELLDFQQLARHVVLNYIRARTAARIA